MHVVIMAAGRGRRLGALTADYPKALIEVAGKPLLGHSLHFAAEAGFRERIVVGGFCFDQVAAALQTLDPSATLVENTQLHAGNLLSLVAGLSALEAGASFLLMNADHIYPAAVGRIVAATAREAIEITAFCDFDRQLGADDMKVHFVDGRVRTMSKQLESYEGGYVGMTWIPQQARTLYDAAVASLRDEAGDDHPVEHVLARLADQGHLPQHADISGHGWHEVDEPAERQAAERALLASS